MHQIPETSTSVQPAFIPDAKALVPHTRGRKLLFLAIGAVLQFLAFAPFKQFYLAWIAFVPWLLVVLASKSATTTFFWAWLGGAISFLAAFVYLFRVTIPGTVALAMYLALFTGLAGLLIRVAGQFLLGRAHSQRRVLLLSLAIPVIYTACEWLRGTLLTGLPLLYAGHTQSPFLAICQIADVTGAYGVTFCVLLVNSNVLALLCGPRRALSAVSVAGVIVLSVLGYGISRLQQDASADGPRLMLVQPNHPMKRGQKSVTQQQSVEFHLKITLEALAKPPTPDLIVWNETAMPPLNPEVRSEPGLGDAAFLNQVHSLISGLSAQKGVAIFTGGYFVGGWKGELGHRRATDIRNSAYLYDRNGQQVARYDKIHLVPFGEFIPFKFSVPWMFQLFLWLGPRSEEYSLTASDETHLTLFELDAANGARWHFVSPICFEDLDAPLIAGMFQAPDGRKRADFIVNLTNDGWFGWNEKAQHLQAAVFRCIEVRAPMARAVNTGISGFMDSSGRTQNLLPANTEGTTALQLKLDSRITPYMRIGDLFAITCAIASASLLLAARLLRQPAPRQRS